MSFDIFLGSFKKGVSEPFPRSIPERAFALSIEHREPGGWTLRFPDGGRANVAIDDAAMITGLGVNRPPTSAAFWEGILHILQNTSSVLFWTGSGCVVAAPEVISDLPRDLIDAVGAPMIVTRPEQILEAIKRSG